ncbi:ABC transporter substrate-binding protein, partial [uncultured Sphaerochaeta sp.]|uniref:ABC transporter substrate-binding protein n=1 Tax=uncultured Sphaerochaeta sp. TaxID=886478 RepID=UPI002613A478
MEDQYTVLVTTKAPYGPTLRNLAVPFAAIVPKDYVSANQDILKTKPVGSGPYKFVSWTQNDNTKLEAFDQYYKGAPQTKNLIIKVIPEASQRTIALETGELDIVYDVLVSDMKRVRENKNLILLEAPSLTCFYISFNMRKPPFNNQLVRQAINMAIDRQLLVDTVNSGTGAPADEIIAPAVYGYYSTGVWEYNPAKAKQLLAQAGYPNGFSTTLWVNNNQSRVEMCQAIQEMLREIGITVKVEVMEFGTFISRTTAGEHDMGYFG